MNKAHLPLFLSALLSLLGFTQSAFATTLFGINFDFTKNSGGYGGGAFLQFDVDPNALPFDQPIDLNQVTGFEMEAWGLYGDGSADIFTTDELDSGRANPTGINAIIQVTDLDPLFPISFNRRLNYDGLLEFRDVQTNNSLSIFLDGSYSLLNGTSSNLMGTWTANMWFDDPLPTASAVPVPAAAWLFGSGLIGLIGVARRKKA